LRRKLQPYADSLIGEYQAGFRAARSTIDSIFSLKQTLEKCLGYNINVYQIYADFCQAYDSTSRDKLYQILHEFKIP
jgi:hypothetical protein